MKNTARSNFKVIAAILAVVMLFILLVPPFIVWKGKYHIYTDIADVKPTPVGIVFGAGVRKDQTPTPMLRDRLLVAKELYDAEKIKVIIVSGDNSVSHYNEPEVMEQFLIDAGIPEEHIIPDYAGRRTYDTCYRAKEIFQIDKALLITQGYHLPRALYLCNSLGLASSGYSATLQKYAGEDYYKTREILAIYKSVLDILLLRPEPILGEKITVEIPD